MAILRSSPHPSSAGITTCELSLLSAPREGYSFPRISRRRAGVSHVPVAALDGVVVSASCAPGTQRPRIDRGIGQPVVSKRAATSQPAPRVQGLQLLAVVVLGATRTAPAPRPGSENAVLVWLRTRDHWATTLVLAVYGALTLAGATTSSLGISLLRQNPSHPLGWQLWDAQGIRSDEYNAFTPIDLSIMATGGAPTLSPLGEQADVLHRFSSGGFFETFVFFDATLLRTARFLPDAVVFAAHWWLPVLVLFLFLPRWFDQIGASRRTGWLAAILIALSPSVAWWSLQPVQQLAYTLAGASLLVSCHARFVRRQHGRAVVLAVLAGILVAGMPSGYVPWSLVLGGTVLAATTLWLLVQKSSWTDRIVPLALVGTTALIFGLGMLWENLDSIRATLDTVYPGSRRSGGTAEPLELLFGAPGLGGLQRSTPTASNASELATSFTVTFIWAFALILGSRWTSTWRLAVVPATVGVLGALWLAWTTIATGTLGARVPLLNLVTPDRATQVVGMLGVLLVALLLPSIAGGTSWRTALGAGLGCGAVTVYAVSRLKATALPGMRVLEVLVVAGAVALVVIVVTRYPGRNWPVVLTALLAVLPIYRANPLVLGLGDLRDSVATRTMAARGDVARNEGTLWASDYGTFDVLMLANGVPSLSGLQRSGPNRAQWNLLDPTGASEQAWNRAGGYVPFLFFVDQPTGIRTNGFDVTYVYIDPCELARRVPELGHLATRQSLTSSCVRPAGSVTWSGDRVNLYDVVRA